MIMRTPVCFIGHGSPLNAIEINQFTTGWAQMASALGKPEGILVVSAHWALKKQKVDFQAKSRMIYDMYGFPQRLYEVRYPAPGAPWLAERVVELLGEDNVEGSTDWGLDHAAWCPLVKMYPDADIPVTELSVDESRTPEQILQIGSRLKSLRDEGVLIMGSGDVVHNLGLVDWNMNEGYPWADRFDKYIKDKILAHDFDAVANYRSRGEAAQLAIPTPEHFYPLLYVLGAADSEEEVQIFNYERTLGSISMTSFIIG
jgi:4,5-DOPA dioxygenase extradiol